MFTSGSEGIPRTLISGALAYAAPAVLGTDGGVGAAPRGPEPA